MVIFRAIVDTPTVLETITNTVSPFLAIPGTSYSVPEGSNILEQMFHLFQVCSKNVPKFLGTFQKRSNISRYIPKMLGQERSNVPIFFQVRSRYVPNNVPNNVPNMATFQKCSSVPHHSRYVPFRSGMGSRNFLSVQQP